jgi:hypothetical protein
VDSRTHFYRLVLLDYDEQSIGVVDHDSDEEYGYNQWVILDEDIWLVAGIEPASSPYEAELHLMYVGLTHDPQGSQDTDPTRAAARAGAKPL